MASLLPIDGLKTNIILNIMWRLILPAILKASILRIEHFSMPIKQR